MNVVEDGIKLQAYLDGELTGREASDVAALLEKDAEARALYAELQQTSSLLKVGEVELRLPESREFYWSKIEREISRVPASEAVAGPGWLTFVRRHVAALGASAVAAAVVMFVALQVAVGPGDMFEEIDNPLDETSSFSFRSESQQMTLVWISTPEVEAEETTETVMPELQ